jgi:DNA-binding CsgD family transcriptional regulator/PAS domain-containing protein
LVAGISQVHPDTQDLVEQIYSAVSEPALWEQFLENLTQSTGAHAARMRMTNSNNGLYNLIAGVGYDSSFDERYRDYYVNIDLWNPLLEQQKPGMIFESHKIVNDNTFRKSEIYNDFFKHYDMFYALGSNIIKSGNSIARIGIHRTQLQGLFNEEQRLLLKQLMPHLQRAFKLNIHLDELQSQRDSMHDLLYRSSTPLILIDEFEQITFVNQQAERILNSNDGLTVKGNYIKARRDSEQKTLQQMIHEAVATGLKKGMGSGGGMRLTSKNGEHLFNLIITPYPAHATTNLGINKRICAAIFIHDPTQVSTLPAKLLQTLYGLTPAETRLAENIVGGLTPAEAAAKLGVSISTTRTQLRALFAKTDTQRQSELVQLLSGLTEIQL